MPGATVWKLGSASVDEATADAVVNESRAMGARASVEIRRVRIRLLNMLYLYHNG